jgi:hypothetical protein
LSSAALLKGFVKRAVYVRGEKWVYAVSVVVPLARVLVLGEALGWLTPSGGDAANAE